MTSSKIKRFFKKAAPGIITGSADNDPAGIATYSISGAAFGFSQLWLMVLATPMLIAVQSMAARLGNVARKGLSLILRQEFSFPISALAAVILVVANVFTIGADILAMASALQLITGAALKFWVLPITILVWYIVLFENYKKIAKFLLVMAAFFLTYVLAAFLAKPDWGEVFRQMLWPRLAGLNSAYFVAAVGILGTTITPYLFFWQVKEEVEEHKTAAQAKAEAAHEDKLNAPGFIFSQIITIFIMIAAGATLFAKGMSIETAADAALALEPAAGHFASVLFAVGILGSGLLALPVLSASTAYVVAETAGWRHDSLSNKIHTAKGFYAVITLSLLSGVAIMVFGVSPIKALYYSQVLAGLLAPFLLVLILILCNRQSLMGEFRNGWFDNFFGTLAVVIMLLAGVMMFV